MTKKLFFTLLTTSALFFAACSNTKDEKTTREEEKTSKEDPKKDDDRSEVGGDIKKASVELCECFNKHMPAVDPAMEKILMNAANSDNPIMTLQNEFMKIENEAERNRLTQSFENMDNNEEMKACGDKIKAKYNFKENDKVTEKQMLVALEQNSDCPLLAAMGKMAMKMEEQMKSLNNDADKGRTNEE